MLKAVGMWELDMTQDQVEADRGRLRVFKEVL